MKILITGITGFIGSHLDQLLTNQGHQVIGLTTNFKKTVLNKIGYCDFKKLDDLTYLIYKLMPDIVVHLGGQSSVGKSWQNPSGTIKNNVINSINLIDACINNNIKKIIIASSAEIYRKSEIAHLETDELYADNPYAVSKLVIDRYCEYLIEQEINTKIIIVRQFPTIGIGQREDFVIASWAKQIKEIDKKGIILVGNTDIIRDFTDIRDTINAYSRLIKYNHSNIFNICSGRPINLKNILKTLIKISKKKIKVEIDKLRLRPIDTPILIGDSSKLNRKTRWVINYSIEETLKNIYKGA